MDLRRLGKQTTQDATPLLVAVVMVMGILAIVASFPAGRTGETIHGVYYGYEMRRDGGSQSPHLILQTDEGRRKIGVSVSEAIIATIPEHAEVALHLGSKWFGGGTVAIDVDQQPLLTDADYRSHTAPKGWALFLFGTLLLVQSTRFLRFWYRMGRLPTGHLLQWRLD